MLTPTGFRCARPSMRARPTTRPVSRIERRHVDRMHEVGRNRRLSRGQTSQPRRGGFARCRPPHAQADVRRGEVVVDLVVGQVSGERDALAYSERLGFGAHVVVLDGFTCHQQMGAAERCPATEARARIASRTRFSGVTFPNAVNTTASCSDAVTRTNPLARSGLRRGLRHAHLHDIDGRVRMGFSNLFGEPFIVHEDAPAGLDDDAQHRPQIGQRSQQTDRAELGEIRVGVGVVEPELAAIVVAVSAATAAAACALARDAVVRRAGRRGPGTRADTPTCSRGRVRCRADRRRDRTGARGCFQTKSCASNTRTRVSGATNCSGRPSTNRSISWIGARAGSSSRLYCAMPDLTGRSGVNHARRGMRGEEIGVPHRLPIDAFRPVLQRPFQSAFKQSGRANAAPVPDRGSVLRGTGLSSDTRSALASRPADGT